MIKVRLSKHIYRNCKNRELGCWAHLSMRLPYAPFPGLIIHNGKGEIMEIEVVKYDSDEKITSCFIGAEDHDDYEYAKKVAKEEGWKLREIPAGTAVENLRSLF
jgi:hypothetical protein